MPPARGASQRWSRDGGGPAALQPVAVPGLSASSPPLGPTPNRSLPAWRRYHGGHRRQDLAVTESDQQAGQSWCASSLPAMDRRSPHRETVLGECGTPNSVPAAYSYRGCADGYADTELAWTRGVTFRWLPCELARSRPGAATAWRRRGADGRHGRRRRCQRAVCWLASTSPATRCPDPRAPSIRPDTVADRAVSYCGGCPRLPVSAAGSTAVQYRPGAACC
jgi:hypothetical protein